MSNQSEEKNNKSIKKDKPKTRGLGRGLDALFADEESSFDQEVTKINDIDKSDNTVLTENSKSRKLLGIEYLFPCPTQPRRTFDEDALNELSESIKQYGLLQPILVRPSKSKDGTYEIVAGERRWRASQLARLHEVPVVIREMDDEEMFQIALVENLQRQDLNPIEEALGYQKLMDEYNYKPEKVAKAVGKSRSNVVNMTRLLALPKSVQVMVEVGDLTMGHARAILGHDEAEKLALKIIEQKMSVRDTEKLVSDFRNHKEGNDSKFNLLPKELRKKGFSAKDADTLALEDEVSQQLGMNVSIDMKDRHQGSMKIDFKSLDQLDEILQRLAQTPRR